jgi:hypothetical protein
MFMREKDNSLKQKQSNHQHVTKINQQGRKGCLPEQIHSNVEMELAFCYNEEFLQPFGQLFFFIPTGCLKSTNIYSETCLNRRHHLDQ